MTLNVDYFNFPWDQHSSPLVSDDRFILKQMPRLEVQSFLDFAPHYFTYITGAVQQKVWTSIVLCN